MVIVSPSCISVKSFNGPNFYNIYCDGRGVYYCQCPFNSFSMDYCKHIYLYKRYQKLKEEGAIIVQQPSIATNIHLNATLWLKVEVIQPIQSKIVFQDH